MPSPFPGMDPYLEEPVIWRDFHKSLAVGISGDLNQTLPGGYYARLRIWPEFGDPEERSRYRPGAPCESYRHLAIEIRDARSGHRLITLIEILSPSNKRQGPDRDAYAAKQRDVLDSDASLIEIDLLWGGRRILPTEELDLALRRLDPPPDYVVLVSRAWRRTDRALGYHFFPFGLREWLPCIPVPLKPDEDELPLDLQFLFGRTYDGGPYRRGAVDYSRPPAPPLSPEDAAWAEALLRDRG